MRKSVFLGVILILAAACSGGDDSGGATTAATSPAAGGPAAATSPAAHGSAAATSPAAERPTDTPGPGTITVSSTAIRGQSGRYLVVLAAVPGKTPSAAARGETIVAGTCVRITSDNFTPSDEVMADLGSDNDPCLGASRETTFEPGTYNLWAGVYRGGAVTPEVETTLSVDVAGDVMAAVAGEELSD